MVLPSGQRRAGDFVDDTLSRRVAESGLASVFPEVGQFPRQRVEVFRGPDADRAVDDAFCGRGWTDGLPVVAPTMGAVADAVGATGRQPTDELGEVDPLRGVATIEKVAANAVMAGCAPEHLPVVVAAVEAILEPAFNLRGVQTTDENVTPLVVVNGPIVDELQFNTSFGVLGPGRRANAAVGRAVRLVMHNLGGGWPGVVAFGGAGQPGRYTLCAAESEDASPWEPLRVELGFDADDSVVIVTRAETAANVTGGLAEIASVMRSATSLFAALHQGVSAVMLAPAVASALAERGLSRADVRAELWERGQIPASLLSQSWLAETVERWPAHVAAGVEAGSVPVAESADDLVLFVAGGDIPIAQHVWFPSWGFPKALIVKKIRA